MKFKWHSKAVRKQKSAPMFKAKTPYIPRYCKNNKLITMLVIKKKKEPSNSATLAFFRFFSELTLISAIKLK